MKTNINISKSEIYIYIHQKPKSNIEIEKNQNFQNNVVSLIMTQFQKYGYIYIFAEL